MEAGFFYDPKHGECLRRITKVNDRLYRITGAYGKDEKNTGDKWTALMYEVSKNYYKVDFSGKKHAKIKELFVTWNPRNRTLTWQDKNQWKLLYSWK